ncbi:MAG: SIR2 family protein [Fluviicola sp.]
MREGNSILFLGAGASIGEKKYLSKEVIEYYEDYLGKSYQENNITRFLDILSADPTFNRNHFDQEVEKMLRKLKHTEAHEIMAEIPWREIITTNYDLLVEQAYDKIDNKTPYTLVPIRAFKKYNYRPSNNEIKYNKLNGCISDKSEYPLAFSSDDFNQLNVFYKNVLNDLKNLSPRIQLLSIGYSFQDDFGRELLEKFDSYNYREKRWIINVDPYPNENALAYYSSQKTRIVKCSFSDFFKLFKEWNDKDLDYLVKKKKVVYTTSKDSHIDLPPKVRLNLNGVVKQLNSNSKERIISDIEYFKGEEPNYKIILKGTDVYRITQSEKIGDSILKIVSENTSNFLPIFFLTGEFGIGKSTFTLRLIHEMMKRPELDMVAFEIEDFIKLKKEDLIQLFEASNAKNIVLFCDEIELDSVFKAVLEIRRELSVEQFNDFSVFILAPIRENILAKNLMIREVKEGHEIHLDGKLTESEINELLEKLKKASLVTFRDAKEKNTLCEKIVKEFSGDSFVSLLELVSNGQHVNNLLTAYHELSKEMQKAFLFTALLHRHKILMPASWLRQILSTDWSSFTDTVLKAEGKGILIQDYIDSNGTDPDIYFKTKHPLIASNLVDKILNTKEKQYKLYLELINKMNVGAINSSIVTNLFKSIKVEEVFTQEKINRLYDAAYSKLSDDAFYLLNYSINLQNRRDRDNLKKALDTLIYAESLLERKNHRFIHRRGVINFELAKLEFKNDNNYILTHSYLREAKELFSIKQQMDPFSSYSYSDYIKLLIWEVSNIDEYDNETELQFRIWIQELFELAERTVTENLSKIEVLRTNYADYLKTVTDKEEYLDHLIELYENPELRPYACILLYSHYESTDDQTRDEKCQSLIEEMESYLDYDEIVKFLFKYYGRRLHFIEYRVKLFSLARKFSFLEEDIPIRYFYYHFIADSYNHNFNFGLEHLSNIKSRYNGFNPEFRTIWKDSNGYDFIFDGTVINNTGKRHKTIKISSLQRSFRLIKGEYSKLNAGKSVKVKLHFYIDGIRAEIIR